MADDSDFSAPCAEVKNGVRCSRWTTFINGDPTPHEHSFPGYEQRIEFYEKGAE